MANSTTNIDTIAQSQASKEVTANAYFDAVSPASLFSRRASTCSGLTWGYYGGNILNNGEVNQIANGTLALTASTTNYVEVTKAGVVSKNTVGFTPGQIPLYSIVTGSATVTSYTDYRMTSYPYMTQQVSVSVTTADVTLSTTQSRSRHIILSGTLTGDRSIIVANEWEGVIYNNCSGSSSGVSYVITVKTSAGTGVTLAQGESATVLANGTDVVRLNYAIVRTVISMPSDTNISLSTADVATQILEIGSAVDLTTTRDVVIPLAARQWTVFNATTGGQSIQLIGSTGTGVTIGTNKRAIIYADGTNIVRVTADV